MIRPFHLISSKVLATLALCSLLACQRNTPSGKMSANNSEEPDTGMHPDWSHHATIYEVNIRQYTPEGTLNAFRKKLPELKKLGVKILWIMPIQPVGVEKRKGSLGSYYSIMDYTSVNPDYGTFEDFKNFVTAAHDAGFKVILDWVANHTSWDAGWVKAHPDWYVTHNGRIVSPNNEWEDVADLNYDNDEMRAAMIEAMKFWVHETDIDGFRCDMAKLVPMDFWIKVREELDAIKPVFMVAEAEGPEYHKAFDMTYGWELYHIMNEIARGDNTVKALDDYHKKVDSMYPGDAYRMYFTTNHDENSWNGTVFERMPKDHKSMFVLAATLPHSMPLIYGGQEYGLNKRLAFFEKDLINGNDTALFEFYRKVTGLKNTHPALANGTAQGDFRRIATDHQSRLYGYMRQKQEEVVLVLLNFSDVHGDFTLPEEVPEKKWIDVMTDKPFGVSHATITLPPHDFVLIKSKL